jgi:RHS repeat-associated protein
LDAYSYVGNSASRCPSDERGNIKVLPEIGGFGRLAHRRPVYDPASRLTAITQGSSPVQFAYDAASRRTTLTLPNGVTTQSGYDRASRLTALTYTLGATGLGDLQYTYDAAGNRIQVAGSWARTGLPQALAAATYNANNQQLTFGGQTLTYDLNGNLTSDGTNAYTWTARNQLATISGPVPASFVYDDVGRRMRKTINSAITDVLYDGLNPIQEVSGAAAASLLTGLGIDEYFVRTDPSGASAFLVDALGSTVALTDAAGVVQTQYTYDPFGATVTTGAASSNPFQYTGRENDGTGLYYYRARYYHPGLARFISEDPLGNETGEVNFYVYVGDDPINYVDPLGLDKENACTFSKRFRNNLRIIHDPIVRRPISFASGLLVSGEVARLTGVPTMFQFARSGFAPIRGYVPIAQTIGLVGATAASLTVTQSAVVVGVVAVGKAVAVGVVLEAGIVTGAAINAAAVQPLLGPELGITGCEGMK